MSDVAAVSGHVTAKPGAGGAKAGAANGSAAAAASVLDGAFAAMLGKAGDGEASTAASVAALLTPDGKAGASAQAALDPVQVETGLTVADTSDAPVGVCVVEIDGIGSLDEKLAKPVKARKAKDDEASPLAFFAAGPLVAQEVPASKETKAGAAAIAPVGGVPATAPVGGVPATAPDAQAPAAKAATGEAALPASSAPAQADEAVKLAAAPVPVDGKPAPVQKQTDAPASANGTSAAPEGQVADSAGRKDSSEQDQGGREKPQDGQPRAAAPARLADAGVSTIDASLRSIVQSLPPVLQSQLAVGAASGPASAPISTGELLGNQVIDMSVQGQWIDRMAREIATLAEGTGHSRFQLSPPNLGKIQVDLWRNDDQMNLRLVTETDEAARRLNEGKSALEAHARVASLSLGQVTVEKASQSDSARDQGQHQQNRQGAEQQGSQGQQQASAQAQGQNLQGRGNGGANRGGNSAVIGHEQGTEAEQPVRIARANDPHVRFA